MAYREDIGTLSPPTRRDNGTMVADAHATRAGVFHYADGQGGVRREYRPIEEVGKADSLSTLKLQPLTDDHPGEKVDSSNARDVAVGCVGQDVRMDGDHVKTSIAIWDAKTLDKMRAGKTQLSCGYEVDLDETPGVAPGGEHYDARQTNIRYNHLAVVDAGRAGTARARVDRADMKYMVPTASGPDTFWAETEDEKLTAEKRNNMPAKEFAAPPDKLPIHDAAHVRAAMSRFGQTQFADAGQKKSAYSKIVAKAKKLGIDTEGFEKRWSGRLDHSTSRKDAMTPEEIQALQEQATKSKARKDERDAARAERDAEKARADAEKTRADKLQAELDASKAQVEQVRRDTAASTRERVALEMRADAHLNAGLAADDAKRVKFDGMTDRQVRVALIEKLDGAKVADDKSDAYVAAYLDHAMKHAGRHDAAAVSLGALRSAAELGIKPDKTGARADDVVDEAAASAAMRKRSREAHQSKGSN